jgi:hypothetical protein
MKEISFRDLRLRLLKWGGVVIYCALFGILKDA